jgi:hypothetical protein
MKQQKALQKSERAERVYASFLRLYPRAHRQAFGEQMLWTFRDHYRDAVEGRGESEACYWLSVVGDEGKSIVREHLASLAERSWLMQTILTAPFEVWRRRQTRRLALVTQLYLIVAVLLVWTPCLVGRVLLVTSDHGLMQSPSGGVSYNLSVGVERPTTQFVSAFMQATANIAAHDLQAYHFRSSLVEFSTFPLARAAVGGPAAPTPPFLLDGESAARLTTDLRVIEGRLPVPEVGVLEVVVTPTTADQLHLALGAALPITTLSGKPAPLVRVVGIVQAVGAVFPTNRATFDPDNPDGVWYWAQSHPLDNVLTSDEAIGAYTYDWAQIASLPWFSSSSDNLPLWQAWWVGTTEYAQMDAQYLNAFVSHAVPDPTRHLNQLLGTPPLAKPTGFVPAYTTAQFYKGNTEPTDQVLHGVLSAWIFAIPVAGGLVYSLWLVTSRLALLQPSLIAARRDRGASHRRVGGVLAMQALALAGQALLAGGLLALLVARSIAASLLPVPVWPVVDTLVGSPFDTSPGLAGGIAVVLLSLAAVLVMLCAMHRAATPEPASDHQSVRG